MEIPEPPECPVCFNFYDAVSSIPRVLTCGHTTCEACLSQLPNPFPNTIRCPSCTQLVKLPGRPSSLPKNIDLLRLSSSLQPHPDSNRPKKVISQKPPPSLLSSSAPFLPNLWSHEFYLNWKNWVLPNDCVSIELNSQETDPFSLSYGKISKFDKISFNFYIRVILKENEKVGLVKIGTFRDESEKEKVKEGFLCNNSCKLKYSYEAKIMKVLYLMKENERDEVVSVLNASLKLNKVGKIYGFWCNEDDNCVFMACEGFRRDLVKIMGEFENGFLGKIEDDVEKVSKMGSFGMIGMEICEVVKHLHVEGLVLGCFSVDCFGLNEFGRVFIDLGEVLVVERRFWRLMVEDVDVENEVLLKCVFVSPELLHELLRNEGIEVGDGTLRYEVGYGSDVWSLACVLIWLLAGKSFAEEMCGYYQCVFSAVDDKKGCNYVDLYTGWKGKVIGLLEGRLRLEFASLKDILCKCLDFDPGSRPVLIDVWKCMRNLVVGPEFDIIFHSEMEVMGEIPGQCVFLGNLSQSATKTKRGRFRHAAGGLLKKDENGGEDAVQIEGLKIDGDVVNGLSGGSVQCINLKGHLDCITGLAVGGDFLFSCSHDKIVNVWSLQDFSHVHAFRSHEHRVTAVVFVDEGEPLCISADNGGVICIWGARIPLDSAPIKKLFEQKDWRFSGIHALAISGSGCLYTGSGDKSIKAWSLQDYTLMCTMTGHKSVVSSLAVCNGVLYSGSWDGTVRLWSLNDHTSLAVLGEDRPGNLSSVLSLDVDGNLLVVAHENGCITIWYDGVLLKSSQVHNGAVFSISKNGKWLFTGGWDKTVNILELSGDGTHVEAIPTGSISADAVITALVYCQGKMFVGQADRVVKVYHSGV
ncbi:hypothetical protein ACH5RR_034105 [Cinchona calisaya]|uniref:Uncharacterized protein n=1 Tax=Cinchona calisaya TaxID=153742 RepID=A0ABD2YDS3_9GENT